MSDLKTRAEYPGEDYVAEEKELYQDPHYIKYIVSSPMNDCVFYMDTGKEVTAMDLTVAVSLIIQATHTVIAENFQSPSAQELFREAVTNAVNDDAFWEAKNEPYFLN